MNYYEKHIGDFIKDTAHLSMIEDGAYNRLLDQYYGRERVLPLDVRECCKLARAVSKPERDAVAYVLGAFFEKTEEGYRQKRCDEEITRFQDKQRKAKASADARWAEHRAQCGGIAGADADDMRTHCEGNAPRARPQTPVTSHQPSSKAAGERGSRLPTDWVLPKEWGDWALGEFPQWDAAKVRREADNFLDHWVSKAGKDATKIDWKATWRKWCRNPLAHGDDSKPAAATNGALREKETRQLLDANSAIKPNPELARLARESIRRIA